MRLKAPVVALVVDDGSWYLGAKLLPFNSITGLGESAVTVEATSNLIPVATLPRMEQLMSAGVKVIGTRTLTRSGHMGGKVVEITIDETGRISACEVEENIGDRIQIPVQQIVTFGKERTDHQRFGGSFKPLDRLAGVPWRGLSPVQHQLALIFHLRPHRRAHPIHRFLRRMRRLSCSKEKQRRYLLGKK